MQSCCLDIFSVFWIGTLAAAVFIGAGLYLLQKSLLGF
jgi:hypothetical protein